MPTNYSGESPGRKRRSAQPGELPAFVYHGFPEANTTPVPDEFFDIIAPLLGEAELRVALYIIRRTRGFKKSEDAISFSQLVKGITTRDGRVLDRGTGLAKSAVARAINGLLAKGVLVKRTGQTAAGDSDTNVYRLHFRREGVVLEKDNPSPLQGPPVVLEKDTQETGIQETAVGYSNAATDPIADLPDGIASKFRKGSRQERTEESRGETPRSASSPRATSQGMAHISAVLQAKAIGRPRTPQGNRIQADPQPPDDARLPTSSPAESVAGTPTTAPARQRRRRRAAVSAEAEAAIQAYLGDFAPELGDQAPFQSSVSRVCNLFADSGLTISAFIERLYAARARTKERYTAIRSRSKRFAYFLALLEEECGLREPPPEIAAAAKAQVEQQTGVAKATLPPKSLAGRYEHLVRR